MTQAEPVYILRRMRVEDIEQVVKIDLLSFSLPWSATTFVYEINENDRAHLGVLERVGSPLSLSSTDLAPPVAASGTGTAMLVAYGGLWLHRQEAHISTIASHPDFRRQGLGELMLAGLIGRGMALKADHVVLEVRIGNLIAQRLYRKYEFMTVGFYSKYYRDNNEDALLMEARPLDVAYWGRLRRRIAPLVTRLTLRDEFSGLQLDQG
jgi:ribosomal-protein-alanine N-acetyltransferase